MSDSGKYTPLSERLQQDVWHDNFVPKYSALASAQPSMLVLIGVWMIFGPVALGSIAIGIARLSDAPDLASGVMIFIGHSLACILATAILFTQTRRYQLAKLSRVEDGDDEDERIGTGEEEA